jgi:metal-sulfur cluster biosynthetic enzyme
VSTQRPESSDDEIRDEAWVRLVDDPELAIDLVNLGLIYDLRVEEGDVRVEMSLTTPGCPMSDSMPAAVERALAAIPGVGKIEVNLVWEPRWELERMSAVAKRGLGWA